MEKKKDRQELKMNNRRKLLIAVIILTVLGIVIKVEMKDSSLKIKSVLNRFSPRPVPASSFDQQDPIVYNYLSIAKSDLVKRSGVGIGEISVLEVEKIIWPDTSLGCPQKDLLYSQMLVPGYRIILKAKNKVYNYHAGLEQTVFCAR